jgi:1,4-alpha-glucan branching enzyme
MPVAAKNDGMGSKLYSDGTCRFRVWAPFAKRVQVVFKNSAIASADLTSEGNGNWSTDVPGVSTLAMYQYFIDNSGQPQAGNDNSQTWQHADARALQVENSAAGSASYVIPDFDQSQRPAFATPGFDNFILYQLHVGSFSGLNDLRAAPVNNRTATFLDMIEKLSYISDLGFNGIALLPIGEIAGDVGEGYGTCDLSAPEDAYASSKEKAVEELLKLVDEAHRRGLAVIFDVVYNHAAIGDNRYWRYDGNCYGPNTGGIYHENSHDTRFGTGFAVWKQEVKDFIFDNARMFLRDYRGDGLRFDATQFIPPDALRTWAWGLKNEFPDKYLIAEYNAWDGERAFDPTNPFTDLGFHATWDLDGYGQCFAALNGTDPLGNLFKLIGDFKNPNPWCSVRYLAGSHDQIYDDGSNIGRRYLTERFGGRNNDYARAKARIAWALTVAIPGTPMLFMGTEGQLDGFWAPENTLGEHRVDWSKMGDNLGLPMQKMVRDVNNLRWQHPALRSPAGNVVHVDYPGQVAAFKRYTYDGDLVLVIVNLSDNSWSNYSYGINLSGEGGAWIEIFNSQSPTYGGFDSTGNFGDNLGINDGKLFLNIPCWSVLMFRKT